MMEQFCIRKSIYFDKHYHTGIILPINKIIWGYNISVFNGETFSILKNKMLDPYFL